MSAPVSITERTNEVTSVRFSTILKPKLKLLEVPPDLAEVVERGGCLYIKGSHNEEAVLCSQNRTYAMKRVETSNSVFLVPPSTDSAYSIAGRCVDYYEVKPAKGKVDHLKETIAQLSNSVPPNEIKRELLRCAQASEAEIESALRRLDVVETSEGLQLLPREAVLDATQRLLNGMLSHGWDAERVDEAQCLSSDARLVGAHLRHVLCSLGREIEPALWCIDKKQLGRASARVILQRNSTMEKSRFADEWLLSTPGANEFDESVLRGLAVEVSDKRTSPVLHFLPVEDLPVDVSLRLEKLFAIKNGFELQEIEPYFADFVDGAGEPQTVSALLLPRTRLVDGKFFKKQ